MAGVDSDFHYKDEQTTKGLEDLRKQEGQEKLRKFKDFISKEGFIFLDQNQEDEDNLKDLEVDIFYKQSGKYEGKKIYDLALKINGAQRILGYEYIPRHRQSEPASFNIRYLNNQGIEIRKKIIPFYFQKEIDGTYVRNFIVVADPTEPIK